MSDIYKISAQIFLFVIVYISTVVNSVNSFKGNIWLALFFMLPLAILLYGIALLLLKLLFVILKNIRNIHSFLIDKPIDFIFDLPKVFISVLSRFKQLTRLFIKSEFNKKCLMVLFCLCVFLCVYFQLFDRYRYKIIENGYYSMSTVIKIDKLFGEITEIIPEREYKRSKK